MYARVRITKCEEPMSWYTDSIGEVFEEKGLYVLIYDTITMNRKFILKQDCEIEYVEVGVGNIGNYYGGLNVKYDNGKYFWCIDDYCDDLDWEEIPKYLYDALIKYNEELKVGDEKL